MSKEEFKKIVNEGIDRSKNFMVVKIQSFERSNPTIVIIQGEDIGKTAKSYLDLTAEGMVFQDSLDVITDVLLTSNLNDLSWFAY